jgi:phage regulator Rha-like protein
LCDKAHDNVLKVIRNLEEKALVNSTAAPYLDKNNQERPAFNLNKRDSLVVVARLSPEFTEKVIDRWQELESEVSTKIPDFSNPIAAAEAWIDAYKKQQSTMLERDQAITTKAWINDKKAATAMNTASQKVKENNLLKDELGIGKTFKTVKAISWLGDFFDLNNKETYKVAGMYLSKFSKQLGYPRKVIEDTNWGTVNGYHLDVIAYFRRYTEDYPSFMNKYRPTQKDNA